MIEAIGVSLKYPTGTMALSDINLTIKTGELIYITGPSGSGKTSLLKLLMGVEYPTEGKLNVIGQEISKKQASKIRKLRMEIGPIFQEFRVLKGRTALENVMIGMRFLNIDSAQLEATASSSLERVGLGHKSSSLVDNLSWGECQRVAIARAISRKPKLILADEPTGNLDKANALNILELLTSLKDKSTSVIITTHATHLIEGDKNARYIDMKSGIISFEGVGSK